eukprot:gene10304-8235_t
MFLPGPTLSLLKGRTYVPTSRVAGLARGERIIVHGKGDQKNKGLYFDYVAVDPAAVEEVPAREKDMLAAGALELQAHAQVWIGSDMWASSCQEVVEKTRGGRKPQWLKRQRREAMLREEEDRLREKQFAASLDNFNPADLYQPTSAGSSAEGSAAQAEPKSQLEAAETEEIEEVVTVRKVKASIPEDPWATPLPSKQPTPPPETPAAALSEEANEEAGPVSVQPANSDPDSKLAAEAGPKMLTRKLRLMHTLHPPPTPHPLISGEASKLGPRLQASSRSRPKDADSQAEANAYPAPTPHPPPSYFRYSQQTRTKTPSQQQKQVQPANSDEDSKPAAESGPKMLTRKQRLMQRMKGAQDPSATITAEAPGSSSPSRSAGAGTARGGEVEGEEDVEDYDGEHGRRADEQEGLECGEMVEGEDEGEREEVGVADVVMDADMDVNAFAQQLIELLTGRGGDNDDDEDGDGEFDLGALGLDEEDDMDLGNLSKVSDADVKKYLDMLGADDDVDDEEDDDNMGSLVEQIDDDESLSEQEKMKALYSIQGVFNSAQASVKGNKKASRESLAIPQRLASTTSMGKAALGIKSGGMDDVAIPLQPRPQRPAPK